jgi:ATP-dependent DNA helicase RecQ
MIDTSDGDATHRRRLGVHLDAMLALCETVECRRVQLLAYFRQASDPCGNCDTCLAPPQTWDGTVAAQKLLSAVSRLEHEHRQRYGAGHVVDILTGKPTPRITKLGHTSLSVFGIGKELSEGEWRAVVRQLLAQGVLGVDSDGYGTLALTDASTAVLRGSRPVLLRREAPRLATRTRSAKPRSSSVATVAADLDARATEAFERLRTWRASTAKEQGVPAYVVFHDATLREIATRVPTTLDELSTVGGVGVVKREKYGARLLEALHT